MSTAPVCIVTQTFYLLFLDTDLYISIHSLLLWTPENSSCWFDVHKMK